MFVNQITLVTVLALVCESFGITHTTIEIESNKHQGTSNEINIFIFFLCEKQRINLKIF
jgi:hypothetical protein